MKTLENGTQKGELKVRFTGLTSFGDRSMFLTVPPRAVFWGQNGSGKTSVLRAIGAVFSVDKYFKRMLSRYSRKRRLIVEVEYCSDQFSYQAYTSGRKTIEERNSSRNFTLLPFEILYFNPLVNPSTYATMVDAAHLYAERVKEIRKKAEEKLEVVLKAVSYLLNGGDEDYREAVQRFVDIHSFVNNPDAISKILKDAAEDLSNRGRRVSEFEEIFESLLQTQNQYYMEKFKAVAIEEGKCPICQAEVEPDTSVKEAYGKVKELERDLSRLREALQSAYVEAMRGWVVSSASVPTPEEVREAAEFLEEYPLNMLRRIESIILALFSEVKKDFEDLSSKFVSFILGETHSVSFSDSGRVSMDGIPYYLLSRGESSALALSVFLAYRYLFNIREFYPIIIDEGLDHLSPDSADRAITLLVDSFPDCPIYLVTHRPETLSFLESKNFGIINIPGMLEEIEEFDPEFSEVQ